MKRSLVLVACIGWAITACSSSNKNPAGQQPPEQPVPSETVDAGVPGVTPANLTCGLAQSGWREMASYRIAGDTQPDFADWIAQPVWNGKEALYLASVEKGMNCATADCVERTESAAFDPVANTWRALPAPYPLRRAEDGMFTAWTGSEWLIFGGWRASTDRYDGRYLAPGANTWTSIPTPPIRPAIGYATIFAPSTRELIVWGGLACDAPNPTTGGSAPEKPQNCAAIDQGAAYSMNTHTWRTIATSPLSARYNSLPVWDGRRALFLFGIEYIEDRDTLSSIPGAAAYDPQSNTWEMLPEPPAFHRMATIAHTLGQNGTLGAFWGGHQAFNKSYAPHLDDGAQWNSELNRWDHIPDSKLFPNLTRNHFANWSGRGMLFVWGGEGGASNPQGFERFNDGGYYNPADGTWKYIAPGSLSPRAGATAVWTGCEAILYGGWALTRQENNKGAIYRP